MATTLRPTRRRTEVVWAPQPGFQRALIACPVEDVFCGGARGPGKTDGLIGDWLSHADRYAAAARGILFRRTYPKLEEIEYRVGELFPRLGWQRNVAKRTWTAPNGARLLLRYLDVDADADNYHGHQYSWQGFDELPDWPNPQPVDKLFACLRSPYGVPCVRRSTGNPGGPGHNWVKARYIDPSPPWVPFTGPDGIERVFIPGRLEDNAILLQQDPNYWKRIEASGPEWLVNAWRWGIWDIVAGGMFDDVWRRDVHVIQPFEIPRTWRVNRSFDWGSAKPFSVGWWAESDGTEAPNGKTYPRGTIFRVGEWYGWNGRPNEGNRMLAVEIAEGILEREEAMGLSIPDLHPPTKPSYVIKGRKVEPGPADSSIYDADRGVSIGDDMATAGVRWTKADKRPGSRQIGWERMRKMFKAALEDKPEEPGLYVFDTCVHFIRTVPTLPRDPRKIEDVDTDAEDHVADEARYRCMERDSRIIIDRFAV
jgi:hypothetical protein